MCGIEQETSILGRSDHTGAILRYVCTDFYVGL